MFKYIRYALVLATPYSAAHPLPAERSSRIYAQVFDLGRVRNWLGHGIGIGIGIFTQDERTRKTITNRDA